MIKWTESHLNFEQWTVHCEHFRIVGNCFRFHRFPFHEFDILRWPAFGQSDQRTRHQRSYWFSPFLQTIRTVTGSSIRNAVLRASSSFTARTKTPALKMSPGLLGPAGSICNRLAFSLVAAVRRSNLFLIAFTRFTGFPLSTIPVSIVRRTVF